MSTLREARSSRRLWLALAVAVAMIIGTMDILYTGNKAMLEHTPLLIAAISLLTY